MNWLIPSFVLFTAMFIGLSMIPSIARDFIQEIKDAFGKENEDA
jgi:hypothetical protein